MLKARSLPVSSPHRGIREIHPDMDARNQLNVRVRGRESKEQIMYFSPERREAIAEEATNGIEEDHERCDLRPGAKPRPEKGGGASRTGDARRPVPSALR